MAEAQTLFLALALVGRPVESLDRMYSPYCLLAVQLAMSTRVAPTSALDGCLRRESATGNMSTSAAAAGLAPTLRCGYPVCPSAQKAQKSIQAYAIRDASAGGLPNRHLHE